MPPPPEAIATEERLKVATRSKTEQESIFPEAMRTRCYFDIEVDGAAEGRVVFELYDDIVPKTAANFRALCTGEKGSTTIAGTE